MDEEGREKVPHLYDLMNKPRWFSLPTGSVLEQIEPTQADQTTLLRMNAHVDWQTLFHLEDHSFSDDDMRSVLLPSCYTQANKKVTLTSLKLLDLSNPTEAEKHIHTVGEAILEIEDSQFQKNFSPILIKQLVFAIAADPCIFQAVGAHLIVVLLADVMAANSGQDVDGCFLPNNEVKLLTSSASKLMQQQKIPFLEEDPSNEKKEKEKQSCFSEAVPPSIAEQDRITTDIGAYINVFLLPERTLLYSKKEWASEEYKAGCGAVAFFREYPSLVDQKEEAKDYFTCQVMPKSGIRLLDLRNNSTRCIVSTYMALCNHVTLPKANPWMCEDIMQMAFFISTTLPFCMMYSATSDGTTTTTPPPPPPCGWIMSTSSTKDDIIYLLDGESCGQQVLNWATAQYKKLKDPKKLPFTHEQYGVLFAHNGTCGLKYMSP